jgi:hypothetical protein
MGTQLFIAPAQGPIPRQHFESSIVRGVSLDILRPLGEVLWRRLEAAATRDRVYVWGALAGGSSVNHWNLLRQGDLCLFYTKKHFPVCGRVSAKARKEIAREIWGTRANDGRAWEYMWFSTRSSTCTLRAKLFVPLWVEQTTRVSRTSRMSARAWRRC